MQTPLYKRKYFYESHHVILGQTLKGMRNVGHKFHRRNFLGAVGFLRQEFPLRTRGLVGKEQLCHSFI